jgi:hypothetical protein
VLGGQFGRMLLADFSEQGSTILFLRAQPCDALAGAGAFSLHSWQKRTVGSAVRWRSSHFLGQRNLKTGLQLLTDRIQSIDP